MSALITPGLLVSLGVCAEHLATFRAWLAETGATGVAVTPDTIAEARRRGLDVAWLARNPATPPAALEALAADADVRVRRGVAGNLATPPAALRALAADADADVHWGVTRNPATTLAELEALAADAGVRRAARATLARIRGAA